MKILLILFTTATICFGQQAPKGYAKQYFDKDWKITTDSSAASYFRTVEKVGKKFLVRDYYISGVLQTEAECKAYKPDPKYDGKVSRYDKNGRIEEVCSYKDGKRDGEGRRFYRSGKLKADFIYNDGEQYYNHFYSPDGSDYLLNGTGIASDTFSIARPYTTYLEFIDGKQVGSFVIEGADTLYIMVEKVCEYKGGYEALADDLQMHLKYPAAPRRLGYQGTVFVQFTVTKNEEVKDFSVLNSIHPDCDAEALRVLKLLPNWHAAEHHNKKVNSKFVMPIKFRLAN